MPVFDPGIRTPRRAITQPFRPTDDEHRLYETLSEFFNREETFSIPPRQRNLTGLILRKLLASSSHAIAGTLDTMKDRLIALRDGAPEPPPLLEGIVTEEEMEEELLEDDEAADPEEPTAPPQLDRAKLQAEIDELDRYITWARSIGVDTKSRALLKAIELGFAEMGKMGAPRKALIFTEWPLFLEWNEQCEPPWSEKELLHKLQDALKQRFLLGKGYLSCDGVGNHTKKEESGKKTVARAIDTS